MQKNIRLNDLQIVVPWLNDVVTCATEATQTHHIFEELRVAIICIDLYRFDSISTSVCEQAIVLATAGCQVHIVCNNLTGIDSSIFISRENFVSSKYDLLIYHYYVGDPFLDKILSSSVRKLVYYQGITTPPEVYSPYSPGFVSICSDGLKQLSRLHQFDGLLSDSDYNKSQVLSATPEEKRNFPTRIFPPVISFERFINETKPLSNLPTNILTVGRIFSSKNLQGVFKFTEALRKHTGVATKLTIAGSKCEPAYVSALLADMTNDPLLEIDICLRASDEKIRELYNQADVFVSFSHHEGFCLPLVEAMATGVPVVTHAMTAITQTMGGGGLVVDPYNYEDAAKKLWEVWSRDGALSSMIATQRMVFKKKYSGSVIASQLISAVNELMVGADLPK